MAKDSDEIIYNAVRYICLMTHCVMRVKFFFIFFYGIGKVVRMEKGVVQNV